MNLRDQIKDMEGVIPHAYQDHLGFWTIGCGRLIDERKGGGLRPLEIDFMLANDILEKTAQVEKALPWCLTLNAPRKAVLVNMCFQMGIAGLLKFAQTLAAVRDGHYDHAAEMMMQSLWATQTPGRAKRLSRQMATGQWN